LSGHRRSGRARPGAPGLGSRCGAGAPRPGGGPCAAVAAPPTKEGTRANGRANGRAGQGADDVCCRAPASATGSAIVAAGTPSPFETDGGINCATTAPPGDGVTHFVSTVAWFRERVAFFVSHFPVAANHARAVGFAPPPEAARRAIRSDPRGPPGRKHPRGTRRAGPLVWIGQRAAINVYCRGSCGLT
jgi:hypothetical protein